MCDDGLYPHGKKLRCVTTGQEVAYMGQAKNGTHIVSAPPLDFIDDGYREVKEDQIIDEQFEQVRALLVALPPPSWPTQAELGNDREEVSQWLSTR